MVSIVVNCQRIRSCSFFLTPRIKNFPPLKSSLGRAPGQ